MNTHDNPFRVRILETCLLGSSILVAVTGALALAGWTFDVSALKSMLPGQVEMKVNTACSFILIGLSLGLLSRCGAGNQFPTMRMARLCASVVALVALVTLGEWMFGWDLALDDFLFRESAAATATTHPGRMAPMTAVNFMLVGSALLLLTWRKEMIAQCLAIAAGFVGLLGVIGYAYGLKAFIGISSYTPMALPAAVAFVLSGIGVLSARPNGGLMAEITADTMGGVVARHLLLVVLVALPFLGWIRLRGEKAGLYDTELGIGLMLMAIIIIFSVFIWWSTCSLNRVDTERKRMEELLVRTNETLEQRVRERTAELETANTAIRVEIDMRKQAMEALRNSEEHFRIAAQTANDVIFEWDLKQSVKWVGKIDELLGYDPGEFPRTLDGWASSVHPEDLERTTVAIQAHLEGRAPYIQEYRVRRKDGVYRWWAARGAAARTPDGKPVRMIGSVTDITERKRAEDEIGKLNAELELRVIERTAELRRTVGELEHFSYSLTHDMRAPLRAMRSFASLLLADCGKHLTEEEKDYLQNIAKSADRMDHLVVDALDYSKAMLEKMPFATVDADALLRDMLASYPGFHPLLANIQIEGTIPPVIGNRAGLTQCFSNVLNNAVKFVLPGQMPQVRIWAGQGNGRVWLWFEDKGIGIPKDDHERIFEMFQRLNPDYPGTGIGLAFVRKVIERMDGRVGVESQPGQGSRFWLDLKAANVAKQEAT